MNLPFLVWLLLSTIWGSTWLVIKIGLEELPPFTFAGIRFLIALIPLAFLVVVRRPTFPRSLHDWWLILYTGFLTFSVNYGLIFWGEKYISSGLTAILYTTLPLFGLVIAHFYLPSEPMTLMKTSGVLLGILGVTIIFANQLHLDNIDAIWGAAAIIVASFLTAYAGIKIKGFKKQFDPLVLTTGQMLIGFVPLLILGLVYEGDPFSLNWTLKAWMALFYLAFIGSSLTFVLLYWLYKKMEVTKTQLIPFASTIIAVILGWLILDEEFNWKSIIGGLSILIGLVLTSWGYKRIENGRNKF